MTLRKALPDALDQASPDGGPVEVQAAGGRALVDTVAVDRLGVRIRSVTVHREGGRDVTEAGEDLPSRVRSLGEPLAPVEVDRGLGGAILRTPRDPDRGFFEVGVDRGGDARVRKHRVDEDGGREDVDFDLTREQLGRLLDELS